MDNSSGGGGVDEGSMVAGRSSSGRSGTSRRALPGTRDGQFRGTYVIFTKFVLGGARRKSSLGTYTSRICQDAETAQAAQAKGPNTRTRGDREEARTLSLLSRASSLDLTGLLKSEYPHRVKCSSRRVNTLKSRIQDGGAMIASLINCKH